MNETTPGAPLTATLGERVGEEPHGKDVREEAPRPPGASGGAPAEPGAATREGLSRSRGASEGKARRPRAEPSGRSPGSSPAARGQGRPAGARPFPWGALALAAVGWALVTGLWGVIRARARRIRRGARRLVTR
jgi:hypothetical protein